MRLRNPSIDGATAFVGLLVTGAFASAVIGLLTDKNSTWLAIAIGGIALACVASVLLFVLPIRIGNDRKKLRDVKRWMGERSDDD